MERLGGGHCVLADHRVDDQEGLVGLDGVADLAQLLHERRVDGQPASGVDDHDVVLGQPRDLQALARDLDRVAPRGLGVGTGVAGGRGEDRGLRALGHHGQLVDGVGPLQVGSDQHGRVPLGAQEDRQLAGQRGLAGALQAREQDDRGRGLGHPHPPGLAAQQLDELLVDDLDDLLGGVQSPRHLGPDGALTHAIGELAHGGQGDVGLEQCHADLADRRGDVGLGEPTLAAQALEGGRQPV